MARPDVLVDTSVWIDFLRDPEGPTAPAFEALLKARRVHTCGVVVGELLQGCREETSYQMLRDRLDAVPFHEVDRGVCLAAARLSYELRRKGGPIPLTDALIATVTSLNHLSLWTLDHHFSRVPGLTLHKP